METRKQRAAAVVRAMRGLDLCLLCRHDGALYLRAVYNGEMRPICWFCVNDVQMNMHFIYRDQSVKHIQAYVKNDKLNELRCLLEPKRLNQS